MQPPLKVCWPTDRMNSSIGGSKAAFKLWCLRTDKHGYLSELLETKRLLINSFSTILTVINALANVPASTFSIARCFISMNTKLLFCSPSLKRESEDS